MACDDRCEFREYSTAAVVLHNIPYALMLALGAAVLAVALGQRAWTWLSVVAYVAYGIIGACWIIVFICPCCPSYGRRSCPCGYGVVASRLRSQSDVSLFARQFKRHIPVIVPLWFIPLLVGTPLAFKSFSWGLVVLMAAFAVNSFIVLPKVSTGAGCKECPQRSQCPWMGEPPK